MKAASKRLLTERRARYVDLCASRYDGAGIRKHLSALTPKEER